MDVTSVGNSMARKKSSKRRTSRRRNYLSLPGTAATLLIADAGTKALFGMSAIPWLTEGWLTPKSSGSMGGTNSWSISLSELVQGMIPGGESFGQSGNHGWTNDAAGVGRAVMRNLKDNGAQSVAVAFLTPVAFKAAKKIFRRPITMGNRL